jgi:predicted GNAT family N-acyltransferase
MAVLKPHRGQGIGSALMRAILSYASQAKLKQLYLHAQVQAIPFYNRFGFTATGEPFMEAGIVHQTMERFDHE